MNKLTKEDAINTLKAWSAIEVLSPQTFSKPRELTSDPKNVATFDKAYLPWENGGEKPKPKTKLFYQVILGAIDFEKAISGLLEKYTPDNNVIEKQSSKGGAIIGVIVVNQKGLPMSFSLSSFAWGINKALEGDLESLAKWSEVESHASPGLTKIIYQQDEEGNDLPISRGALQSAYDHLIKDFEIPEELCVNNQFAIRVYESITKEEAPYPFLLNSFYLDDLEQAKLLIKDGCASSNLKKYLGMVLSKKRLNILNNDKLIENLTAPKNISPTKWPRPGRHPLVLLQQIAVNLTRTELQNEGVLAVNGPPGTGKTTLIQDVMASIITDKAEALLKFDDPSEAFTRTNHKISVGKNWLYIHEIDESLKGFEMLIASSNNKAVENLSAELPSASSIADDAELKYFNVLSDELIGSKSWGLISAVLGNSTNRYRFRQKFWWDPDYGLSSYFAEIAGTPQIIDVKDPKTGKITETRQPRIISESNIPQNHQEALIRWNKAKKDFTKKLNNCRNKINELENFRQNIKQFEDLTKDLDLDNNTLEEMLSKHQETKPNILKNIFRFSSALKWEKKFNELSTYHKLQKEIEQIPQELKNHFINKNFFFKNHVEKNKTSPWCDEATQILRDEVFIESIKLTKAFIDAAAEPLLNNIGILMNIFCKLKDPLKELTNSSNPKVDVESLENIWSSFFLVVPSISTTFASVSRMLGSLPNNYLGWLIIDEAGQALPQAAIGAIMRTKRAFITGDPMQIEPVVALPEALTNNICRKLSVDINRFNAPRASVQTIADSITPYYAEFLTKNGSRSIGLPLLVHRRCSEPMFSIANVIAYERLMVQAKTPGKSSIRDCLGPSIWFDTRGQTRNKWCIEEGNKVIQILNMLKSNKVFPDLYIITPFREVADNLRTLIQNTKIMNSWVDTPPQIWANERVGTVHTVQGREADSVILVLGAPSPEQNKARLWAGSTPNILNVAVTRAKENVYVIGNMKSWKEAGVFRELPDRIEHSI